MCSVSELGMLQAEDEADFIAASDITCIYVW